MLGRIGRIGAVLVGVAAVLTGCATPSVHPVWSEEKNHEEPALAGTWRPVRADDRTSYTVEARGDAYRLTARNDDPERPASWEFLVRLAKFGPGTFADISAPPEERGRVGERWGPFFVPTHMFVKYELDGDALRVWLLRREWLEKSDLAWTSLSKDVSLITAPTPELQKFIEASAGNPAAFGEAIELRRAPR